MGEAWGAYVDREIALEPTSQGALSGTRFAVKDIFDIRGYAAGAGSPEWRRTHAAAPANAEAVERLLARGARLTGTTQTDELMFSLNGENYHYGTPINPKAPRHIPGGSSSGSAVAVAAGLADFALGSDTGGSIRIPASYCGLYGFRPTHGAVSSRGMVPLAPPFDTVGWVTRDAELLRRVGDALLPPRPDASAGFRRLLIAEDLIAAADPDCAEMLRPIASRIGSQTETSTAVTVSEEGLERWKECFRTLQGLEIRRTHREWIRAAEPRFGPGVAERFAWALALNPDEAESEWRLRDDIRRRMAELLGEDGVLIAPTAPGGAPLRGSSGSALEERRARTLQLCCVAGLAGLPQATLPLLKVGGLPAGVSLIAGPGQDVRLLAWVKLLAESI